MEETNSRDAGDLWARPDLAQLPDHRRAALDRLVRLSACPVTALVVDRGCGAVLRLTGNFAIAGRAAPLATALDFIATHGKDLGWDSDPVNYELVEVSRKDDYRWIQLRLRRDGFAVAGADVRFHFCSKGSICEIEAQGPCLAKTRMCPPRLSEEDAADRAKDAVRLDRRLPASGRLVLLNLAGFFGDHVPPRLAWLFQFASADGHQDVYVDADSGDVPINHFVDTTGDPGSPPPLGPLPQYSLNPTTGVPRFVSFGTNGLWLPESSSRSAEVVALAFFRRYPLMFATGDVPNQLRVTRAVRMTDAPYTHHVILQQIYGGLPVYGCELRVHLSPAFTVLSISGNYLRDPRVIPEVRRAEGAAQAVAITGAVRLRKLLGNAEDPAPQIKSMGPVIWPGVMNERATGANAVAWRFRLPEVDLFVDADDPETGEVLAALPNHVGANVIYDAMGGSELTVPTIVLRGGTPAGGAAASQEARDADSFLTAYLSFIRLLGRPQLLGGSIFGASSDDEIVVNSNFTLTPTASAHWDIVRGQAWFTPGSVSLFLVGHEMTHGLAYSPGSAWLTPIDEPGAVSEHFSDVLGAAVAKTAIPQTSVTNYAAYLPRTGTCTTPLGVFGATCDTGNVHTNNGIGNRAAALIAAGDGTPARPGFGLNRTARLFADVLVHRLHPWSGYIDECLNAWQVAREFAASQIQIVDDVNPSITRNFTGMAAEVRRAFFEVGVDPDLLGGWFAVQVGVTGGAGTATWFTGETVDPCRLVTDIELQVRSRDPLNLGLVWWEGRSRFTGPGGGAVTFPGGIFGAAITTQFIGTRAKDTAVRYFHSGFLPLEVRPYVLEGPDPSPLCIGVPPPPPPGDPFVVNNAHWSFLFGDKGNDIWFAALPGGSPAFTFRSNGDLTTPPLVIRRVRLDILDRNGAILQHTFKGSPPALVRYGAFNSLSWGAGIVTDGTGTTDPMVDVRWWFDVGVACRYQLVYEFTGGVNPIPVLA